jgi:hypothetical protein
MRKAKSGSRRASGNLPIRTSVRKGSDHPSAKLTPIEQSTRHLSMYDPKTGKITLIRTCFPTHHLVFAEDADNTLWTSAGGPQSGVIGWLNRKMFEETGDEAKSQGWSAIVLDTNGNGKRDEDYVEPNQPVDPAKDKRITGALYGIGINPVDNTVWGSVLTFPGYVIRVNPGANPPATTLAEVYEPPLPGYGPRGMDIDRNGVAWVPLSSGHMASFDRRKCTGPLNGPAATGKHCPEGWTLYPFPGPQLQNVNEPGSAEASYYTWVDQFNTFGLGENVPMATGNANESLLALVNGQWVNLRVPIRWATTPNGWTAASTIRTAAGRAAGCGRRSATARRSTSRAAKARAQGRALPAAARSAGAVDGRPRGSQDKHRPGAAAAAPGALLRVTADRSGSRDAGTRAVARAHLGQPRDPEGALAHTPAADRSHHRNRDGAAVNPHDRAAHPGSWQVAQHDSNVRPLRAVGFGRASSCSPRPAWG